MGAFFVYIVKVSFCVMLLYLPYSLLLRNEKWHALNRFMLLGILVLSYLIPLVRTEWLGQSSRALQFPIAEGLHETFEDGIIMMDAEEGGVRSCLPLLLVIVYFSGLFIMLCIRTWQLVRLYRFMPNGCLWKERMENGIMVYCHAREVAPFSWMHKVVISCTDWESDAGNVIMKHETAHALFHHSYDAMLMLMAEILMWFNPMVWMIEMDLRCIHEYQADAYVLAQGVNMKNYQIYLIKKAVGSRLQSVANGLNQSTLKKRIAMMYKKSNKWAALKYMYVLPVGAITTMAFAHPEFENRVSNPLKSVAEVKISNLSETMQMTAPETVVYAYGTKTKTSASAVPSQTGAMPRDTVYRLVEEMPLYPGGNTEFMKFLMKNIKYPKEAIEKGVEGKVIVQFIVRKDGTLTGHKVVKSENPLLNEEALRVTRMMPKWIPGKQDGKAVSALFNVPVTFRLR